MRKERTDTAHEKWDQTWQTAEGRAAWSQPEADVKAAAVIVIDRGLCTALDFGCGVGRHALYLAEQGLTVSAFDASRSGIQHLQTEATKRGLQVETTVAPMTEVPYPAEAFDYVLAWNVIYHGNLAVVQRSLAGIMRVLRPGGLFQGTFLSKRNSDVATGRRVAHNTYVNEGMQDKGHPHYYCSALEVVTLLEGYELLWLKDVEHDRPGSHHWQFLAEKR